MGDGEDNDILGNDSIIGSKITAPQTIQGRIKTRQSLYPGLAKGQGRSL